MSTVRMIDNRGSDRDPFGYIYFLREDIRLSFAIQKGSKCLMWIPGGWGFPHDREVNDAVAALKQKFPQITKFEGLGN